MIQYVSMGEAIIGKQSAAEHLPSYPWIGDGQVSNIGLSQNFEIN